MRRRLLQSCFIAEAEFVGSGDAMNPSSNLPCLRSRVLAMNSPIIASGRPKTIKARRHRPPYQALAPPTSLIFPVRFNRQLVEQKAWKPRVTCKFPVGDIGHRNDVERFGWRCWRIASGRYSGFLAASAGGLRAGQSQRFGLVCDRVGARFRMDGSWRGQFAGGF
jgi:hypothetical protein